jgi:hypothetical protein
VSPQRNSSTGNISRDQSQDAQFAMKAWAAFAKLVYTLDSSAAADEPEPDRATGGRSREP